MAVIPAIGASVAGLNALPGVGSLLSSLGLGGLGGFGGSSSKSSSSSSSSVNVAVNPSIAVVSGPGSANPSTSGYASGSASASATTGSDGLPGYLPTSGSYGPVSTLPQNPYGAIDTARAPGLLAGVENIFSDPLMLVVLAGGALLLLGVFDGKKARAA